MTVSGTSSPDDGRTGELLDKLFAVGLDSAEWQELMAAAADDPVVMRRYIEVVHLREGLPYLLSQQPPNSSSSLPSRGPASTPAQSISASHRGRLPYPASRRESPTSAVMRPRSLTIIAVCVAFLLGAVGSLALTRMWGALPFTTVAETPGLISTVGNLPSHEPPEQSRLGRITGISPEVSSHGSLASMQVGQELRCGEVVQLAAGFVRVRLESGTELIIEGPAEFSLLSGQLVFIRSGRVAASGDKAFVLQSPLITIDCRDADLTFVAHDTSAHVFTTRGTVEVFSTPRVTVASEQLRVLDHGEGMVAQAAEGDQITVMSGGRPSGGVTSWNEVEQRYPAYQQLVLKDRPLAYWPLDQVRRNRRVLDLSQNGFDGLAIGTWPLETVEISDFEYGTYFNGESYIEPDRKPPIDLMNGFTVEAWALIEGEAAFQSVFASRWVIESNTPEQQCFGFTLYAGKDDHWQFWTGNGRPGKGWDQLRSPAKVNRQRWTHVVATFTPTGAATANAVKGVVGIYIDGQRTVDGVHEISRTDFEWPARIGAAEFVPQSLTSWLFKGYLRDVAIYDYPLSEDIIRAHRRVGQGTQNDRLSRKISFEKIAEVSY